MDVERALRESLAANAVELASTAHVFDGDAAIRNVAASLTARLSLRVSADSTAGLDVGQIAVAIANAYVEHDRHRSAHTDHKGACQYPRPLPSWLAERIVAALSSSTPPEPEP